MILINNGLFHNFQVKAIEIANDFYNKSLTKSKNHEKIIFKKV